MCTVSVIPIGRVPGGFRLAINRDELVNRPRAEPPAVVETWTGRRALRPIDTQSGGTWVAANDAGLVLALLNRNVGGPPAMRRLSRGLIIPALVGLERAAEAIERLGGMDLSEFAEFRLVAADADWVLAAVWDGAGLSVERGPLAPVCFASSGLGDERVRPRVELFREMVSSRGATPSVQDEFHRHRWADRPEVSVMMERPGARTVSMTVVESDGAGVEMRYYDDAGEARVSLPAAHPAIASGAVRGGRGPC